MAGVELPHQNLSKLPVPSEALVLVSSSSPKLPVPSLLLPPLVVTFTFRALIEVRVGNLESVPVAATAALQY